MLYEPGDKLTTTEDSETRTINNTNDLDKIWCIILPINSIVTAIEKNLSELNIKFVMTIAKTRYLIIKTK